MKPLLLLCTLLPSISFSGEFDIVKPEDRKNVLQPMSQFELQKYYPVVPKINEQELRRHIPLLPRMKDDDEKQKLAEQKALANAEAEKAANLQQEQMNKTFAKKGALVESAQKREKIHTTTKEVSFFDEQIESQEAKPVNLE